MYIQIYLNEILIYGQKQILDVICETVIGFLQTKKKKKNYEVYKNDPVIRRIAVKWFGEFDAENIRLITIW